MKKKETEYRRSARAPMKINAEGEVVFVEPPHDPMDFMNPKKERISHKPTPIMLCNEVSKMFRNIMRENVDDQRVQGSYREILFHLAHEDGRSQLDLARLTHLKPPTVSVALAKLEAEGYVTREADPMDARRTRVYLTDKGKAIDEKAHEVIRILDRKAVQGFSAEEIKQLMVLLFRLRENIADEEE